MARISTGAGPNRWPNSSGVSQRWKLAESGSCRSASSASSAACLPGPMRSERIIRSIGSESAVAPWSSAVPSCRRTFPGRTMVSLGSTTGGTCASAGAAAVVATPNTSAIPAMIRLSISFRSRATARLRGGSSLLGSPQPGREAPFHDAIMQHLASNIQARSAAPAPEIGQSCGCGWCCGEPRSRLPPNPEPQAVAAVFPGVVCACHELFHQVDAKPSDRTRLDGGRELRGRDGRPR